MSIQMMLLGTGAVATKTYVDDVFSTYVYKGSNSNSWKQNGVGLHDDVTDRMVWIKNRTDSTDHWIFDTKRGANSGLNSNNNNAVTTTGSSIFANNNFQTNGFVTGSGNNTGGSGKEYASWTFGTHKGFFDVVTYTGTGSAQSISHDLGSVPGMYIIKRTTGSGTDWQVFHRAFNDPNKAAQLNESQAASSQSAYSNGVAPTSTTFTVNTHHSVNNSGDTYICYLFAGGESTAATARSVNFDSASDSEYLRVNGSSDLDVGTGDFCFELWVYPTGFPGTNTSIFAVANGGLELSKYGSGLTVRRSNAGTGSAGQLTTSSLPELYQWTHIAIARSGTAMKIFFNGKEVASGSVSTDYSGGADNLFIGTYWSYFPGKISNFRLVKGSAVYTSSFRPPTEPLTNITNTKLLCCNNSSITGSTVTPSTISSSGTPVASSDSPFDDPAGFVFGDAEDQNVIKCGSYVGNGSTDGPEINLGFEPQWLMIKCTSATGSWGIIDCMRGIVTGGNDAFSIANGNNVDYDFDIMELTPTGFKITASGSILNTNNETFVYTAIRRSDGYVGKPPELGTGVFAMGTSTGNSGDDIDSGFPVDFGFAKRTATAEGWYTSARLMEGLHLYTDTTAAEASNSYFPFDNNVGWTKGLNAGYQAFMWKRHAGFDVVTYEGNGVSGRQILHSMNKTPEMIVVKRRSHSSNWFVYHIGLNGGTNPANYHLRLDDRNWEASSDLWNDTAPTSTHFTLDDNSEVNGDGKTFIAILFSSVDGISKCGYYSGSNSSQTITTGFAPRFVMIKSITNVDEQNWYLLDTTRGWGSGNDNILRPNLSDAQTSGDLGAPTSTGFTLTVDNGSNSVGRNYIYYAHA